MIRHHIEYNGTQGACLVLRKLPLWFRALDRAYWTVDRLSGHRLCVRDRLGWDERADALATDYQIPLADGLDWRDLATFLWDWDDEDDE